MGEIILLLRAFRQLWTLKDLELYNVAVTVLYRRWAAFSNCADERYLKIIKSLHVNYCPHCSHFVISCLAVTAVPLLSA